MLNILNKLPKGKMLKPSRFNEIGDHETGSAIGNELRARKITLIGEDDGHFHIHAKDEHEFGLAGGGRLKLATRASFAYEHQVQAQRIVFDQFEGVSATRPGAPGWFDVLAIEIVPGQKKKTVQVSVVVKFWLTRLPLTETHSLSDLEAAGWTLPAGFKA